MAPNRAQPVIIIKRKSGHGGHHGGAWKVAYADFVTAMMALFIVLWLMGSSDKVKKAVAGYFNDPKGTANLLGTTMAGNGVAVTTTRSDDMQKLKEKLEEEIKARKELEKLSKQIEITVTPEGLRIELIEDKNGTFYQSGSARLSDNGQELLALLAGELKTLPNNLLIEGHTDATQYSSDASYTNWELSADRANSARRLLQQDGVRSGPGHTGARLRRPASASKKQSVRSVEPANFHSGKKSGDPSSNIAGSPRCERSCGRTVESAEGECTMKESHPISNRRESICCLLAWMV